MNKWDELNTVKGFDFNVERPDNIPVDGRVEIAPYGYDGFALYAEGAIMDWQIIKTAKSIETLKEFCGRWSLMFRYQR